MSKKTVMLVDDIYTNLDLLSDVMAMGGFNVITATSAVDALEKLQHVTPDLFALDVMMPDIDGFDLCRQLRQDPRFVTTPVIFLSAYYSSEEQAKADGVGAADYISKPYSISDVLKRVKELIAEAESSAVEVEETETTESVMLTDDESDDAVTIATEDESGDNEGTASTG